VTDEWSVSIAVLLMTSGGGILKRSEVVGFIVKERKSDSGKVST
jgi:hypothetical protein